MTDKDIMPDDRVVMVKEEGQEDDGQEDNDESLEELEQTILSLCSGIEKRAQSLKQAQYPQKIHSAVEAVDKSLLCPVSPITKPDQEVAVVTPNNHMWKGYVHSTPTTDSTYFPLQSRRGLLYPSAPDLNVQKEFEEQDTFVSFENDDDDGKTYDELLMEISSICDTFPSGHRDLKQAHISKINLGEILSNRDKHLSSSTVPKQDQAADIYDEKYFAPASSASSASLSTTGRFTGVHKTRHTFDESTVDQEPEPSADILGLDKFVLSDRDSSDSDEEDEGEKRHFAGKLNFGVKITETATSNQNSRRSSGKLAGLVCKDDIGSTSGTKGTEEIDGLDETLTETKSPTTVTCVKKDPCNNRSQLIHPPAQRKHLYLSTQELDEDCQTFVEKENILPAFVYRAVNEESSELSPAFVLRKRKLSKCLDDKTADNTDTEDSDEFDLTVVETEAHQDDYSVIVSKDQNDQEVVCRPSDQTPSQTSNICVSSKNRSEAFCSNKTCAKKSFVNDDFILSLSEDEDEIKRVLYGTLSENSKEQTLKSESSVAEQRSATALEKMSVPDTESFVIIESPRKDIEGSFVVFDDSLISQNTPDSINYSKILNKNVLKSKSNVGLTENQENEKKATLNSQNMSDLEIKRNGMRNDVNDVKLIPSPPADKKTLVHETYLMKTVKAKWKSNGIHSPDCNLTTSCWVRKYEGPRKKDVMFYLEGNSRTPPLFKDVSKKTSEEIKDNMSPKAKRRKNDCGMEMMISDLEQQLNAITDDQMRAAEATAAHHESRIAALKKGHSQAFQALRTQQNIEMRQYCAMYQGYMSRAVLEYTTLRLEQEHKFQVNQLKRLHQCEMKELLHVLNQQKKGQKERFEAMKRNKFQIIETLRKQNNASRAQMAEAAPHSTVSLWKGPCKSNRQKHMVQVCLPIDIASYMIREDEIYDAHYVY